MLHTLIINYFKGYLIFPYYIGKLSTFKIGRIYHFRHNVENLQPNIYLFYIVVTNCIGL
jgi:hypothetical protein